jgi:flavin-dependent dehydrogenase
VTNVVWDGRDVVVQGERQAAPFAVQARLVILATGVTTTLLRRMGVLKTMPPLMLAARAYFDGLAALPNQMQIHFAGVPLPGYGWVFPLSTSSANVGAIVFRSQRTVKSRRVTGRGAFDALLQTPLLRQMLAPAQQIGPVKGYPLRVDFTSAPTFSERVLIVGEAAGLVNPLTGEGIDYALESGVLAAEHAMALFDRGDFSLRSLATYDAVLRRRYQRLFVLCRRLRLIYNNPAILSRCLAMATRRQEFEQLFTTIIVDNVGMEEALSPITLLKLVFTRS